MLMRTDPFRELDRLTQQVLGTNGTLARPSVLDNLDTEHIAASYDTGVLTLLIPVAEQAKPRKISITSKDEDRQAINA